VLWKRGANCWRLACTAGIRGAHGMACPSCVASPHSMFSLQRSADICTPMGRPLLDCPSGRDMAGPGEVRQGSERNSIEEPLGPALGIEGTVVGVDVTRSGAGVFAVGTRRTSYSCGSCRPATLH
jgi:hypothetical protein